LYRSENRLATGGKAKRVGFVVLSASRVPGGTIGTSVTGDDGHYSGWPVSAESLYLFSSGHFHIDDTVKYGT